MAINRTVTVAVFLRTCLNRMVAGEAIPASERPVRPAVPRWGVQPFTSIVSSQPFRSALAFRWHTRHRGKAHTTLVESSVAEFSETTGGKVENVEVEKVERFPTQYPTTIPTLISLWEARPNLLTSVWVDSSSAISPWPCPSSSRFFPGSSWGQLFWSRFQSRRVASFPGHTCQEREFRP